MSTFTPIDEVGLQWGGLWRTRPDLARPERSPMRTVFFAVLAVVGAVFAVLVVVDPDAVFDAMAGGRREGLAVIGGFALPFLALALGVVGLIFWSRRWRVPGGGRFEDAWTVPFDHVDPDRVHEVLRTATSQTDPVLVKLSSDLRVDNAPLRSRYQVWVKHSPSDRLAVALVITQVPKDPDDPQSGLLSRLEREPVVRRDGDYLDFGAIGRS